MKKVISFSLFGNKEFYAFGAVENAKLALEIFPDWKTRFYVDDKVKNDILEKLLTYNAEIVNKGENKGLSGVFWRFEPMFEKNTIMLSRDTDSRLSIREKKAVDQWLKSGKAFHIMRDHPKHGVKIMAGMFGCKPVKKIHLRINIFNNFKKTTTYGDDQFFLSRVIYPIIKNNVLIHSSCIFYDNEKTQRFPTPREGSEFVGMSYRPNVKRRQLYVINQSIYLKSTKRERFQVIYYKLLSLFV